MVLLVGQVPRDVPRPRGVPGDRLPARCSAPIAKWVGEIDDAERIPELIARALRTADARAGPGPVVLALPEDVLVDETDVAGRGAVRASRSRRRRAPTSRGCASCSRGAERPLAIVGGAAGRRSARDVRAFCEASELPVAASFRCQDYVDNRSPVYAGHLDARHRPDARRARAGRRPRARASAAGSARSRRAATRCSTPPRPQQTLVHVHPDAGRARPRLRARARRSLSALPQFAAALRALEPPSTRCRAARGRRRPAPTTWRTSQHDAAARRRSTWRGDGAPARAPARRRRSSRTAPATTRSGCTASTSSRATRRSSRRARARWATACRPRSRRSSCSPERIVVCVRRRRRLPDERGQELATAAQYGLPIVVLVVDNGMYGTIRMHQERHYPGRVVGTDLVNPDFAAFAAAFGAHGETVERTADFAAAFERALASGRPASARPAGRPRGDHAAADAHRDPRQRAS